MTGKKNIVAVLTQIQEASIRQNKMLEQAVAADVVDLTELGAVLEDVANRYLDIAEEIRLSVLKHSPVRKIQWVTCV
jgi:hypothetical protein